MIRLIAVKPIAVKPIAVKPIADKLITVAIIMTHLTGCATLFGRNNRDVRVVTNPPGALIKLDGNDVGKSPVNVTVRDVYANNQITADLSGYSSAADVIRTSVEPVTFVNLLLLQVSLVGFVVDWASGNMFDVSSREMTLKLDKKSKARGQEEI